MNKISLSEKMSQGQHRTSVITRRVHQPQMNVQSQIIEELDYSFLKVLTKHHDLDFDVICSDGRFKIHKWVLFMSTDFFDHHISSDCDCLIFSELGVDYAKKGFEMVYTGRTKVTSMSSGIKIIEAFRQIGIKNVKLN